MPASTWEIDLQGVRALAHSLYCSCQSPSSVYRPLATSIRILRNKLEEADEALEETSIRAKDTGILRAVVESKTILNKLKHATQQQLTVSEDNQNSRRDTVTNFLKDIDETTLKLSHALEALECSDANTVQSRESSLMPRTPSTMTSQSDDGNQASTASSSWSFRSRPTSLSQRLSTNSEHAGSKQIEEEKQAVISQKIIRSPHSVSTGSSMSYSASHHADGWNMSPSYFDPMSLDIDSASSLITGRGMGPHEATSPSLASFSLFDEADHKTDHSRSDYSTQDKQVPTAPTELESPVRGQQANVDRSVKRSSSIRQSTPLEPPHAKGRISRISRSFSRRNSPAKGAVIRSETTAVRSQHTVHSESDTSPKGDDSLDYHAISSDRTINTSAKDNHPGGYSTSPPVLPAPQLPPRSPFRPQQVAKSKHREVNTENPNAILPHLLDSKAIDRDHEYSSRLAAQQEERQIPLSISNLHEYNSPSASPAPRNIHLTPEYEFLGYDISDNETIKLIVRLWNETLWDQAKFHIKRLASRHNTIHDSEVTRRMQHLLGVIHSLQGDWQQALSHFAAVFNPPVAHAGQLDVGHCAAAYWMGDIYALLNSRDEVLLAYSLAARSPLLLDARWLPLRECLLMEQELYRKDMNPATNLQVQPSSDPNSLTNPRILPAHIAQTILQLPDNNPTRTPNSPNPLKPSPESRATTLQTAGLRSGFNPSTHSLPIETTAFDPSTPWPFLFDPFFILHNVHKHTLPLSTSPTEPFHPTTTTNSPETTLTPSRLPKKTRLAFTCQNLSWLLLTLRKCLTKLSMQWVENFDSPNPKFIVQYTPSPTTTSANSSTTPAKPQPNIATQAFFTIPLHRLSFRPGYGVDICPDGIFSSRAVGLVAGSEGECREEVKRIRKLIGEFLAREWRLFEAREDRSVGLPVVGVGGR